jgi:hypothetical protein
MVLDLKINGSEFIKIAETTKQYDKPGLLYQPVYIYRYPAVTVYHSGINGIPLFTARIQNPNYNDQ